MKKLLHIALTLGAVLLVPAAASAQQSPYGKIEAEDGQFLGWLDPNSFNSDSICSSVGRYGGIIGNGIFSEFGAYGSRFNPDGVYNPNARKPPKVIDVYGRTIRRVTINTRLRNDISPEELRMQVCGR